MHVPVVAPGAYTYSAAALCFTGLESQAGLLVVGHMHVSPVVPLGVCVAAAGNEPLGGANGPVTMLHVLPAVGLLLVTSGACAYPAARCAWSAGHGRDKPMHGLPH